MAIHYRGARTSRDLRFQLICAKLKPNWYNTVRGVLRESLKLQNLERQVNQALWAHLNTRYWKGPQKVAVDLVEVPYHGLAAKDSDEIRRGQAKQGTTHFHVFATAYVVRQHRRVTLVVWLKLVSLY